MPRSEKDLKRRIRRRMDATGERYTTARAHLLAHDPARAGIDSSDLARSLGRAIRLARRERGWPLAEAADRAGVARLKLDLVERGAGSLAAPEADQLCRVLDLAPGVARAVRARARPADPGEGLRFLLGGGLVLADRTG